MCSVCNQNQGTLIGEHILRNAEISDMVAMSVSIGCAGGSVLVPQYYSAKTSLLKVSRSQL